MAITILVKILKLFRYSHLIFLSLHYFWVPVSSMCAKYWESTDYMQIELTKLGSCKFDISSMHCTIL